MVCLDVAQRFHRGPCRAGRDSGRVVAAGNAAVLANVPRIRNLPRLLGFVVVVLYDIVVANVSVAIKVLGPLRSIRPGFVELPLELEDDFAIALLASTISLTPGTVSADVSPDRRTLLIHGLDVDDAAALVAEIKQRYERPLKEIFEC